MSIKALHKCVHALCVICSRSIGLVVLKDVVREIHQNHLIVLLSRCFVAVDHVHIEVHTFLFTNLFVGDVVNGIVNYSLSTTYLNYLDE